MSIQSYLNLSTDEVSSILSGETRITDPRFATEANPEGRLIFIPHDSGFAVISAEETLIVDRLTDLDLGQIRLHPDLCWRLVRSLQSLDWDSSERGDVGTQDSWDADGEEFQSAVEQAVKAINETAGIVNGNDLANALEDMHSLEMVWGDDPQTRRACRFIAKILDWNADGRDLVAMLRAGEA